MLTYFKLDEDEHGGLRGLAEVLMGYGEHHFDGSPNQKGSRRGVWAGVLLMCGQFERVSSLETTQQLRINDHFKGGCGIVGTSRY
jgi:nuclear pore complex protein Nup93